MHLLRFLFLIFGMLALTPGVAQKRVQLQKGAGQLIGGIKNGERIERVIDNVVFVQNTTTIYCDSAWFYRSKNSVEAFGRVRIVEGDSIVITASRLEYDGNAKTAKLRNNVVFTKLATAKLFTDYLDYYRPSNEARYYNGGRLVDSINVLTSKKGYYNANSNLASFKRDVKVTNPDYTMTADSLQYNSRTKIIYFVSETNVVNKDSSSLVYKAGRYNTVTRTSDLKQGIAQSQSYELKGNAYDIDDARKIYKVRGDVVMTYKDENLLVYGQSTDYYRVSGYAKVYDRAYVAKVTDEGDTLFMTADTLVSIDSTDPAKKRILAYHNVKIFKKDLQGVADSLEYRAADSTIYFYEKPVLWTDGNQMTADSISMLLEKNTISKIFMVNNAFVVSKDSMLNYNQIKGRRMTAEFKNEALNHVRVEGNGESLYFALDEKTSALTGMNKIICSNMVIRFVDRKVNNLSFYVKPEANFVPPHELTEDQRKLDGFEWQENLRPARKDVVKYDYSGASPDQMIEVETPADSAPLPDTPKKEVKKVKGKPARTSRKRVDD